jgi:hypothetical protein
VKSKTWSTVWTCEASASQLQEEVGKEWEREAYLVADFTIHGYFHGDNLAEQSSVKDSPEVTEAALLAHEAGEMHHVVCGRRVLAVSGFLVGIHFGGCEA